MSKISKWIAGQDSERLIRRTRKSSMVILLLMIITLGPACYVLGYYTAHTAYQLSALSRVLPGNVLDSGANGDSRDNAPALPIVSVDALVQNSSIAYLLQSPCGQTATQAKASGCYYDMVEMAWVPEECYDRELEEELGAIKQWTFFRFLNRTSEMSWEEARKGDFEFLVADWDYHTHHCLYRYHKFFRAVAGRGLSSISEGISGWHHMRHCRDINLSKDERTGGIIAKFWPKFPDCGIRHW